MINLIASIQADKNMRRNQKNITLTPEQEIYVRENYKSKSTIQMGTYLGIGQCKVYENMRIMGLGSPFAKHGKKVELITDKFFNPNLFDCWVTG